MINTDVVIVGAGPAGAATAIYLARHNIPCVIIDQAEFPRYHIGESLTGEVGQRIRDLGLEEYMVKQEHPHKFGVNVFGPDGQHTFRVPVMKRDQDENLEPAQTWQVPRDVFDNAMLDKAKEHGAQYLKGRAKAVRYEGSAVRGVHVVTDADEQTEIASKVVVDASGQATFLHRMGVTSSKYRGAYDKQLAVYSQISGGIRNEGAEPDNTLILYKSRNHWAWFIPLSAQSVSVGVVVPSAYYRSKNESLEEFFRREVYEVNPELKRRLPSLELLETVRGSSNYSYAIDQYVGDGFLCVGDAHRFIDPVFSFGVHLAIHEAELAAKAISRYLNGNDPMGEGAFSEYQRVCEIGMDTIQELVDAFWNNPHAFAHAAHYKYREEIVDLFAGRIYKEKPSRGLIALQRINQVYRAKTESVANDHHG